MSTTVRALAALSTFVGFCSPVCANWYTPFDSGSDSYPISDITPVGAGSVQSADDFFMTQSYNPATQKLTMEWWGGLASPTPPQLHTLDFAVRIFNTEPLTSPAVPTQTPFSEYKVTVTGTPVAAPGTPLQVFHYQAELFGGPALNTGTMYWMSIVDNDEDTGSLSNPFRWRWGPGITVGDYAFRSEEADAWIIVEDKINRAFRITVSEVPEPSSIALMLCALPGAVALRRRARRGKVSGWEKESA